MSTTYYEPSRSAAGTTRYVMGQRGERAAAMTCDTPGGPAAFAARAHALTDSRNREVEALHYRQSFSLDEMDPRNPDDIQRCNDLGCELAHRMHPHADALVVTHIDGKGSDGRGGKLHNHIIIANHDNITRKALSDFRSFLDRPDKGRTVVDADVHSRRTFQHGIQSANDALMAEHGLSVAHRQRTVPRDWEMRREDFSPDSLDRQLGDRFQAALEDPRATDRDHLEEVLDEQWAELTRHSHRLAEEKHTEPDPVPRIELRQTIQKKTGVPVWTLAIEDLDHAETKRRWHRKKAGVLSEDFTRDGAQEFLDYHNQQHELDQERMDHERSIRQNEGEGRGLVAVSVGVDEPGCHRRDQRPDDGPEHDEELGRRGGEGRHLDRGRPGDGEGAAELAEQADALADLAGGVALAGAGRRAAHDAQRERQRRADQRAERDAAERQQSPDRGMEL